MSEKHTPGPWAAVKCTLNPFNALTIVADNGRAVASIEAGMHADGITFEESDGELSANIALIAAAPDLLEALLHIQRCIPLGGFAQIHHKSDTWAQIDAAIAKATGAA
jgi:hypothetical protein